MVKSVAILFGIVFIAVGILGFVPGATTDQMLLGIFHVNPAHNAVHILTGVVALLAGMAGAGGAKMFFRIFGLVYALVAVLGLMHLGQDTMLLGLISNNDADTYLHIGIAVVSLLLGFVVPGETAAA